MSTSLSDEILAFFKAYDKDNSGFITPDEIAQVLKEYGYTAPDQDVKELMDQLDKDKNGRVNYEEFYNSIAARY
ncbi:uncharacterized protein LOC142350328 [Convolutriloba macropyga]|uniref:uncharacterized protein LOC142350328 n=1 Tax=Convolutriloba macropyga TaxID=536237 RepID=UPI003F5213F7